MAERDLTAREKSIYRSLSGSGGDHHSFHFHRNDLVERRPRGTPGAMGCNCAPSASRDAHWRIDREDLVGNPT